MNKLKIFIGLADIASFIDDWAYGFEANNCDVLKGSKYNQAPIQTSKVDFSIQKTKDKIGFFRPGKISVFVKPLWDSLVEKYYFNKSLRECDVFFFIWETFKSDFSDLKKIKNKNKKIVTIFVGDDVRWYYAMKQEFLKYDLMPIEYENYDYSINGLKEKLTFLRNIEKYSDVIYTQPCALQLALRPYQNLFIPINPSEFLYKPKQNKKPLLIHAPTSLSKGTKYVELAVEKLKIDGIDFDYKCLKNVPREIALEEYANADIILDQLLIPGGGKLAYECLAMGKVVVTFMAYGKYEQNKPKDCPLVDANKENLFFILKDLINNYEKRTFIASQGLPYIQKYHNSKQICADILEDLKKTNKQISADFTPTFFREEFIPESKEALVEYNKWNQYVADCDWYKETVKSGEREGLVF
jgi:hypothetical protein